MDLDEIKLGIIGSGGWGTALSIIAKDYNPIIWSFEKEVADDININHQNSVFLKGIDLPKSVSSTCIAEDINNCNVIVLASPSQFIRSVILEHNFDLKNKIIVNVAKGIEKFSLLRMSEVLNDAAGIDEDHYVVLTGPSHAEEVAIGTPTTVVSASSNYNANLIVQKIFTNPTFRVYSSDDVCGCELGGSLKNVIAIAAGILDGLGFGDNTKAALLTRGLAEMSRLGVALGANPLTFSGLSGLGDLFVTCNSRHSRNRFVGEQIGKGKKLNEILKEMKMVAEGVHTTDSAYHLGKKHLVEMPIAEQMYKILFENVEPLIAIKELMNRQSKREWWW